MSQIHLHLNSSSLLHRASASDTGALGPFDREKHMKDSEEPNVTIRYLEALRELAPLIAEHRVTFDRERRLPDVVINALADAGLFRLWLPRSLGGPELAPLDFMRVVEAASALDGSVGWLVGNGGGMSRVGGYLPAAVARDWFLSPGTFIVSATGAVGSAEVVNGCYRV